MKKLEGMLQKQNMQKANDLGSVPETPIASTRGLSTPSKKGGPSIGERKGFTSATPSHGRVVTSSSGAQMSPTLSPALRNSLSSNVSRPLTIDEAYEI